MKSKLLLVVCLTACLSFPLSAEDMFLSLTRRPTPVESLPTNIDVMHADEIEQLRAQSLADVIGLMTSVNTSRSGSEGLFSSIRLRGAPSSAQVQIVIDDQPYGGVSADQLVDLSRIPVSHIERIEIVRGGSSVLYGANTTGGVIHIITKQHSREGGRASVGYERRSFDTDVERYEVGGKTSFVDTMATYTRFQSDGFQRNGDVEDTNSTANVGMSFGNGGRIALQVAHNDHKAGIPQGTSVPISDWNGTVEREAANPTKRNRTDRFEGRLVSEFPIATIGRQKTVLFGSNENYLSHKSISIFDTDFEKDTHILGGDTRFMGNCGFTMGFSYERDEQRTSIVSQHHTTNVGSYIQQEIGKDVKLIPALRFDQHSIYGNQYNPRFSAIVRQSDSLSLSANVARSFRAPDFAQLFFESPTFTPNPDLKPEIAWTYDMGFRWAFLPQNTLKVTRYFTDIRDRITFVNNPGLIPDTYQNTDRAEVDGIEVELENQISRFHNNINYAYRRSRGVSASGAFIRSFALTPRHIFNFRSLIDLPARMSFVNTVQYVTEQFSSPNNAGIELPTYAVWNARLSKRFRFGEIFGGVDNVTDRRYAESFDFDPNTFVETLSPMPPRTYRAGVTIEFASAAESSQ